MSPIATLVVIVLAAVLWFGVLRPRLRAGASRRGEAGGSSASLDGGGDRSHDRGHDAGDGGDGGGDGGGD